MGDDVVTAASVRPEFLRDASEVDPVAYNYAWPDATGKYITPTEPYVPVSAAELSEHPWMSQYVVTGIQGAKDPYNWKPEDLRNDNHPFGVFPHIGRAPRVPLRQDSVPSEVIKPIKRVVYQRELYGNNLTPHRRDIAGNHQADIINEHVRFTPTHGPYGCKTNQVPGATYGIPSGPAGVSPHAGFANGFQMTQRTTNKHSGRLRILRTADAEFVTYMKPPPNRQKQTGITNETMTIGDVRLPRNVGLSLFYRDPTPGTTYGGTKSGAPVMSGVYVRPNARTAIPSAQSGDFAAEFSRDGGVSMHNIPKGEGLVGPGEGGHNESAGPEVLRTEGIASCRKTSGLFGGVVTDEGASVPRMSPEGSGYVGAPGAQARGVAGLRPTSLCGKQRMRRAYRLANSQTPLMGMPFSTRESTMSRDQIRGPLTHRQTTEETDSAKWRVGVAHYLWGAPGAEAKLGCCGDRVAPSDLRPTNRVAATTEGTDRQFETFRNRTLMVQRSDWLTTPTVHKKTPLIQHDLDPVFISGFINNPYRAVPVGDGKGGWLQPKPAPQATRTREDLLANYYIGDPSQL